MSRMTEEEEALDKLESLRPTSQVCVRMAKILSLFVKERTNTTIVNCTWNEDNTFKMTDDQGIVYYVTVTELGKS